ncbi:MAG: putative entericidin like toxin protein [Herbinix sp.]|jgi:hypothetical protein|nr:putative entericidin like toxin protein [Herbinix sp.]
MLRRKKAIICIAVIAAILTLVFVVYSSTSRPMDTSEGEPEERYDRPPFVFVNDTLYKRYKEVTSKEMDDSYTFLGNIESSVSTFESPKENFQANDDIIGAEVYQSGDNIIILYNGYYTLYCQLE